MESDTVTADILDSVTLSCEMYGYFPEDLPEFRWTVNAWPIDSSHPHYNISTSRGTRLIQNGGNISIPSVISTLSIFVASECMFGMYLCQVQDRFGSPMLLLRSGVGECHGLNNGCEGQVDPVCTGPARDMRVRYTCQV